MLYLLQFESGFAYFIKNESTGDKHSENASIVYEVWIGHVVARNLQRVV